MDSDSPRSKWGELKLVSQQWRALISRGRVFGPMAKALTPYIDFVDQVGGELIPWKHRWYIFFHGQLPEDF